MCWEDPLVFTECLLLNMVRVTRGGVKRVKNNPKMAVDEPKRGWLLEMDPLSISLPSSLALTMCLTAKNGAKKVVPVKRDSDRI